MKVLSCLLVALFAAVALAAPASESQIVSYTVAQPGVHRWLVSLRVDNTWGQHTHRCSGSIIHSAWLVTAAHCIAAFTNEDGVILASFRAWSGTNLLSSGGSAHVGIRAIIHPQYTGPVSLQRDFALIEVENIGFNNLVEAIPLNINPLTGNGISTIVAGWGAGFNGGPPHDELRQHTTNTLIISQCINQRSIAVLQSPSWVIFPDVNDGFQLCTSHPGQGICQMGDAGSPLITTFNVQLGVASWGFPCAIEGIDVYERVSNHPGWIRLYVPL